MKKWMSLLLAAAMMLSLMAGFAVSAGAEETYTYISDVYYSANGMPKTLAAGQPLPEITLRPSGSNQYTMSCAWLDAEENEIPAGTLTEFGKTYCLRIKVFPLEGYAFEKDAWIGGCDEYYTVGTLGDGAAELWSDKYYTAWNDIEKVEITLAEPKVGEGLAKPVVVSGEATADSSFWVEYAQTDERVEYGVLAKAGYIYQIFLNLSPMEGYTFTEDTQILFNGKAYDVYDASSVSIYINYDLRIVLDTFAFDLAEAVVGQPFPQAVVAGDAGYTATTVWEDMYTDSQVEEDAVVVDGGIYRLSIALKMDRNHKVAEEVTLTVNGEEPVGHYSANPYSQMVNYNQVVTFAQPLEKVEVTFHEPTVGEAPSEISVPEGANYSIDESTYWMNLDDNNDPVEIIQKGNRYELNLYISPAFGYAITEDTQMYVNGEKISENETSSYWTYLNYCTRYSFKTVINKVELPAFPEVKVGDTLPTGGGEGENYTYEILVEAVDAEGNDLTGTTVVEGGTYVVSMVVTPNAGCEFAEDVEVTVGGNEPSKLCYIQSDEIREMRVYSFGGYEIIDEISVSATIPWIGQRKGGAITCANDAGYKLVNTVWAVSSDETYEDIDDLKEPLEAGQHVLMVVELSAEEGYVFSSDLKVTVNGQAYYAVLLMGDATNVYAVLDLGEAADPPDYNGLVVVDDVWGYYEGGILQENYTGLVPYGDNIFYVENGILDFSYTGLVWYMDAWRYVANSLLTDGYTGLVYFDGNWFYAVNSCVDWTFTGLVPYEGNYFYIQNNLLDFSYTGLGYHEGEWYFILNGLLKLDYTGLVNFNDTWFYIEEGHLTWDYTGLVEYEGNWFYVQNNLLDWSFTGLGYINDGWYYVENALLKPEYNGLAYFNETWFYINDGQLTWTVNGLREHDGKLYYITNSEVNWSYTGKAEYNGVEYDVKNGAVEL